MQRQDTTLRAVAAAAEVYPDSLRKNSEKLVAALFSMSLKEIRESDEARNIAKLALRKMEQRKRAV